MVQLRPAVLHESAPGFEVAVYPVIADPPLVVGCCHVIVACPDVAVALTFSGGLGALAGTVAGLVALASLWFPPV